jgi:hypothetical protein
MQDPVLQFEGRSAAAAPLTARNRHVVDTSSTARMLTALRVLTTFYQFGETATLEDIDKVRGWAGDRTLSTPEAAAVVVRRELDRSNGAVAG